MSGGFSVLPSWVIVLSAAYISVLVVLTVVAFF
jgi:hypothetical protein